MKPPPPRPRTTELLALADQLRPPKVPARLPELSRDAGIRLLAEGRRAEEDGDHDRAFAKFHEATLCPAVAGEALLASGRLERSLGRRQQAVSTLKDALHRCADDRTLSGLLFAEIGQLYWAMGEDDEAEYYVRRAAAINPALAAPLRPRAPTSDVHELHTRDLDISDVV
ncbi:MAG: tetratricopeptide repeat protein [Sandaracinaceae bacterium]